MNYQTIASIALVSLFFAASCKKSVPVYNNVVNEIKYDTSSKIEPAITFLGSANGDPLGSAINNRVSKAGTTKDAAIIVVKSSDMKANSALLEQAWLDGKTIVELNPTVASHSAFWSYINAPSYLNGSEDSNDLILIAIQNYSCYQLQNPFLKGVFEHPVLDVKEEVSPDSSPEEQLDLTNETATPIAIGRTVEFLDTKLNSLVEWLNERSTKIVGDAPVPTFDGDLSKRISDANYSQNIRKTFNVGADNFRICKVALSDPDCVTRHSTIDLDLSIIPLYGYEKNKNNNNGDYYFVTMSLVSHNAPLYGLYKEWHGWVRTWAHAFYGKKLAWDATLMQKDGSSYKTLSDISFFDTPVPATTETSKSYTTGFSASLNVSGQGGISGGAPTGTITVGGTFTWSNSQTETVSDQSIVMNTEPGSRKVSYEFHCNNDAMEDSTEDAIKAIARSDQKCRATWCWHVSSTKDDDTGTQFAMKFDLNPEYGYMWRHATWTCEGNRATTNLLDSKLRTTYFDIRMPNRTRCGVIEIKSTTKDYMKGLTIIDANGKTVAQDDGAYEKNLVQRYQVPVGTYKVEYEIRNGDTGDLIGKYRLSDVVVQTAETTVKSSFEGDPI